jgi:uncharacterized protein
MIDTPFVLLNGSRQTGKTTLAQAIDARKETPYFTLDDATMLALAAGDPLGFICNLSSPIVLNEFQKVPAVFPAIRLAVDKNRHSGRFLLTSSASGLSSEGDNAELNSAFCLVRFTLWQF